jgi:hypothetical protein
MRKSRGSEGGSNSLPSHKSPSNTLATIGSRPSRFIQKVRDPFAATVRRDSFNTLDSGFECVNRGESQHQHHELDSIERADSEMTLTAATYQPRKGSEASTISKEPQVQVYTVDDDEMLPACSFTTTTYTHPTLDSSNSRSH